MHLPYRFIPASVLLLSIVSWIFAAPVVNGSKVRQFLGGVTGKLVYTVFEGENGFKNGRALYYVDFKDEILIERKIIQENDAEPRNAIISNDGIWVTYNTMDGARQSQSFICKVMENAPEKITIGNGAHPHWWVKPGTFEEYIITNTGDLETFWQLNFPSAPQAGVGGGETYCQRIIDKRPSGNRTTLLPYFANAGRSRDGAWMFTSGRATGMYHIDSLATNNATIKEEIPFNDTIWGCNPSTSPTPASSDVRVMFLGESHKMFYIAKVRGEIARTITKDSSDGNIYFDTPEWSTHPDYAAVVASPKLVEPPFDVYLYRIHDDSLMKVLDGNYYWPHLWVEGGDKIPVARKQSAVIKTQVSLYPTGNILHISGISGTKAVLSVNDLKGSTICSYTITNNTRQIALKVQQGVYTAVIKEKGSVTVVKSIIIS